VFLFTLLLDSLSEEPQPDYWQVFYDISITESTLSFIQTHAKKLVSVSLNMETWAESNYHTTIRMVNGDTLNALRQCWIKYSSTRDRKSDEGFRSAMQKMYIDHIRDKRVIDLSKAYGAFALSTDAQDAASSHMELFWRLGVQIDEPGIYDRTCINPLFAYSMGAGDQVASVIPPGQPLMGFHLAPALTPLSPDSSWNEINEIQGARCEETLTRAILLAYMQFRSWCMAFKELAAKKGKLRLRFFVGEETAFCFRLAEQRSGKPAKALLCYAQPWSGKSIQLDENQYSTRSIDPAPLVFNVVDASDLSETTGLVNLLIAIVPLLEYSPATVLHTENVIFPLEDEMMLLSNLLLGDVGTVSSLFGIAPAAYLNGTTTRRYNLDKTPSTKFSDIFHRIAWKLSLSGDPEAEQPMIIFQPQEFAELLVSIYKKMFNYDTDEIYDQIVNRRSVTGMIRFRRPQYSRLSFAALLAFLKPRVYVDWKAAMAKFELMISVSPHLANGGMNRGFWYLQEMVMYWHLFGIEIEDSPLNFEVGDFHPDGVPPLSSYRHDCGVLKLANPPKLTCLILTVPRRKLQPFHHLFAAQRGNLNLVFQITLDMRTDQIFNASILPMFGKLTVSDPDGLTCHIEHDEDGWGGSSDLHICAYVPTYLLLAEDPRKVRAVLTAMHDMTTWEIFPDGRVKTLFAASILDRNFVHLVKNFPGSIPLNLDTILAPKPAPAYTYETFDVSYPRFEKNMFITRITFRGRQLEGATIKTIRVTPCTVTLSYGGISFKCSFPFPVDGRKLKLRIVRNSGWIEAVVPLFLNKGGYLENPFSVFMDDKTIWNWNFPSVHFGLIPKLKLEDNKRVVKACIDTMLSTRERNTSTGLSLFKSSLSSILEQLGSSRNFEISVSAEHRSPLKFFGAELFYDDTMDTVVIEAHVLVVTSRIIENHGREIEMLCKNSIKVIVGEEGMKFWRATLPGMAERCRDWEHKDICEYMRDILGHLEREESPICSCGMDMLALELLEMKMSPQFLSCLTRVAISPLYAAPYVEETRGDIDRKSGGATNASESCRICNKKGSRKCARCMEARYCSKECQVKDWKVHKKTCSGKKSCP
jgi:MYND finger